MYQIQAYVRYGANGVFQIKDIVVKKQSAKERKQYYVLEGIAEVKTQIVTPVDNPKLRAIVSKEDVKALIDMMPMLPTVWTEDKRTRNERFKDMIASNDIKKLAQVIKTIYLKKLEKQQLKKQLSDEDLRILAHAEEILCEEIALSCGIDKADVTPYILSKVPLEAETSTI